jgi:FkbM family methyltransferase
MNKIKRFIVQLYVMVRHPKAIKLYAKGIKYDHYCELNKGWIKKAGINTVMDVGANVGDFAKIVREVLPDVNIYSLEPLPDCFEKMKNVLPGDKRFFPINIAAGSKEDTLKFYRSFHSPSSSFLQMENVHKEAFPQSKDGQNAEALNVKVNTLDNIFSDKNIEQNILLKIDVQGFESEVIDGAKNILSQTSIILIEMSFVKLYKDLPLFHEIYTKLYNHGFKFRGNLAQMLHPVTGEVVQVDAIFVRE